MILQNVIYQNDVCDKKELYFHGTGEVRQCRSEREMDESKWMLMLRQGEMLSTDTYMNGLAIEYWKTYTNVSNFELLLRIQGNFEISLCHYEHGTETIFQTQQRCIKRAEWVCMTIPEEWQTGTVYFRIYAKETTVIENAFYRTLNDVVHPDVRIAVNICTYRRKKQLENNIHHFKNSAFFQKNSSLYGRLKLYIIDNGGDFQKYETNTEWIQIYQNFNHGGGSGGFDRGLREMKKAYAQFPYSYMVFMDDDVEFLIESFYRLYAFLGYIKPQYAECGIAGRMFRMDHREIQYTAAEIWNHGNIVHVGGNQDMSKWREENLLTGEYGGWWLCAYPAVVTLRQRPFPFFIHCDDVEYGLRNHRKILTLPGFQVWHETYEYRQSRKILYYDLRNTMIVNLLYNEYKDVDQLLGEWKYKMDQYHNEQQWEEKYLIALALWHLSRVSVFGKKAGMVSEVWIKMLNHEKILKMITPVMHRMAENIVRKRYEKIIFRYKEIRERRTWQ